MQLQQSAIQTIADPLLLCFIQGLSGTTEQEAAVGERQRQRKRVRMDALPFGHGGGFVQQGASQFGGGGFSPRCAGHADSSS